MRRQTRFRRHSDTEYLQNAGLNAHVFPHKALCNFVNFQNNTSECLRPQFGEKEGEDAFVLL